MRLILLTCLACYLFLLGGSIFLCYSSPGDAMRGVPMGLVTFPCSWVILFVLPHAWTENNMPLFYGVVIVSGLINATVIGLMLPKRPRKTE